MFEMAFKTRKILQNTRKIWGFNFGKTLALKHWACPSWQNFITGTDKLPRQLRQKAKCVWCNYNSYKLDCTIAQSDGLAALNDCQDEAYQKKLSSNSRFMSLLTSYWGKRASMHYETTNASKERVRIENWEYTNRRWLYFAAALVRNIYSNKELLPNGTTFEIHYFLWFSAYNISYAFHQLHNALCFYLSPIRCKTHGCFT